MTDNGARWDNRRRSLSPLPNVSAFHFEQKLFEVYPHMRPLWNGPTSPFQARICDAVMVSLGCILAQRQFDKSYDVEKILRAAQNIRRMP